MRMILPLLDFGSMAQELSSLFRSGRGIGQNEVDHERERSVGGWIGAFLAHRLG